MKSDDLMTIRDVVMMAFFFLFLLGGPSWQGQ